MSFRYEVDVKLRVREKFYSKVRHYLEDIESDSGQNHTTAIAPRQDLTHISNLKEENLYGVISKTEFDSVLKAYDRQQEDLKSSNNPVQCDQVRGGSFAKLLFSKPGFHNPGSTKELVGILRLKDTNRESFLGGHSAFNTSYDNSLESIENKQLELCIREEAKRIYDLIVRRQDEDKITDALYKLTKMNHDNGDIYAVVGRWALRCKQYEKSISQFELALVKNCWDTNSIATDLAEACCALGLQFYTKGDFAPALDLYTRALSLNYNSVDRDITETARLHICLCQDGLAQQRRRFGTTNAFATRRK